MKKNRYGVLLLLIFLLVLGSRLYIVFQEPNFTDDKSYYNLRQVDHIIKNKVPIFDDPLSYGGRSLVYAPLFHYILAFFSLFMPLMFVGKIIPNIFISFIVVVIYLIIVELTNSRKAALLTALIAGFIPVLYSETINTVSEHSLTIPLTFLMVYLFMKIKKEKAYTKSYIYILILLSLISPSVFIIALGMAFFIFFVFIEKLKQDRAELEVIIFSILYIVWSQFLIHKKAFLAHGQELIRQNIPESLLVEYFAQLTAAKMIYLIGILPFFFGIYIIYKYLFREKNRDLYLIFGFILSMMFLLLLKLIPLNLGLMYLGLFLMVLFGKYLKLFISYIQKTRVARLESLFIISLLFVFLITSIIPSIVLAKDRMAESFSEQEIKAMIWIKKNTEKDSVILATLEEGHLITAIAERRNVADSNFLLIQNADIKVGDVDTFYKVRFETDAINILNSYGVDYIYFSDIAKKKYNIEKLVFTSNYKCFKLVYDEGVEIYKSQCNLGEE